MHPKLRLDNLKRLPLPIRDVAETACGPTRSWEPVAAMQLTLARIPELDRTAIYPVCYVNLDTARMPTIDQLEVFSPATESAILSAAIALDTILQLLPEADVARALWPRIWACFSWLHMYRDHFPTTTFKLPKPSTLFVNLLLFTSRFSAEADSYEELSATAGFAGMITRAWAFLEEAEITPALRNVALYGLCRFMLAFTHGTDEVDDLVEGAGGSIRDLGKLVLSYLHATIHRPPARITDIHVFRVWTVLHFLEKVDFLPDPQRRYWNVPLGPLCTSLLYLDFVESLVDAILCLIQSPGPHTADALKDCFILLSRMLTTSPGYLWLPEAIEKGLFRIIILCDCMPCDPDARKILREHLKYLLQSLLPGNLIYYYVLVKQKDALDKLVLPATFYSSPIFETWTQFLPLSTARIQLLTSFLSEFTAQKVCDNSQCGAIRDKSDFRRCSGCQAFYYCSQACQLVDWRTGRHQRVCRCYGYLGLTSHVKSSLVTREREFLRALLDQDYQTHRVAICVKQVLFMAAHPDVPFTSFDYSAGAVQVTVASAVDDSGAVSVLNSAGAEWIDSMRRAAESDGRIQLHVMQIVEGNKKRFFVVPLRTNSSGIYQKLREMSREIAGRDEAHVLEQVEAILRDESGMVEIH